MFNHRIAAASVASLWLVALAIAVGSLHGPTQAQPMSSDVPKPTWHLFRSYQVWHDELPDQLEPEQVEIVVLAPNQRCRPPPLSLPFGISLPGAPDNVTGALCSRLESFVNAPPDPLPVPVRLSTQPLVSRSPAAIVAALTPAAQRRYVALLTWQWREDRSDIFWHFEEAVVDRETGRWVWHAARSQTVRYDRLYLHETTLSAVQTVLRYEMPRDLLTRGWWRKAAPVPDGRWVAPAGIPNWQPGEGRAGLVIVNDMGGKLAEPFVFGVKLWPAGSAEIEVPKGGDMITRSTRTSPQITPLMPSRSHVFLDLPGGDYMLRVGADVEPLRLEAGRVTVLRRVIRFLTSADAFDRESEAWWSERLSKSRSRQSFLAEPPDRGAEGMVTWFLP